MDRIDLAGRQSSEILEVQMAKKPAILLAAAVGLLAADASAEMLALQIAKAEVERDRSTGAPTVLVTLQPGSAAAFGEFTARQVGRQIRVRSGDMLLSEPFILEPILVGRITISGNLTLQSANDLVTILRSEESALTVEGDDR